MAYSSAFDLQDLEKEAQAIQSLMELSHKQNGKNHPVTVELKLELEVMLQKMGRLEEAESLVAQVVAGRRKKLGDCQPDTVASSKRLDALTSEIMGEDTAVGLFVLSALAAGTWVGWKLLCAVGGVFRH